MKANTLIKMHIGGSDDEEGLANNQKKVQTFNKQINVPTQMVQTVNKGLFKKEIKME